MDTKHNSRILRLPLRFFHKGKRYEGEIVGKVVPFNKYFTIRIPGADMLILEALPCHEERRFSWVTNSQHEFGYLVPLIGREIEKYIV